MRLYVFSDGVYEVQAPDGALLDLDGLQDALARPPCSEDLDAVYALVRETHGMKVLDDDFSLVRVEFL
jgi:sigma-B regulation protein RsbU (phosphoserine phosphatase)